MSFERQRILTGIQPTNRIHIGNYIGAIKQIQNFQEKNFDIFLFVPDLHSLTNENCLKNSVTNVMKVFLATCSENICYYIQSQHLEIAYISWFFSCCTPIGQLFRMTQFKSKESESINSGYLFYPILMAADILSIDAKFVPVGIDQKQHIELTRDICDYFEKKFQQNIFIKPEAIICESVKINSLQDPTKKMSKSDLNSFATIFLDDSDDEIKLKIKKAVTDSENMPENILEIKETRPGIFNLCQIYKEFSDKNFAEIEKEFAGKYISIFKQNLTDLLVEKISVIREKINNISEEKIAQIISRDFPKVHEILQEKTRKIKEICGFFNLEKRF
jgi:tryptophanyl-tRNA synthetase